MTSDDIECRLNYLGRPTKIYEHVPYTYLGKVKKNYGAMFNRSSVAAVLEEGGGPEGPPPVKIGIKLLTHPELSL